MFVTTETDGFRERPSPIGIESDPRRRKALVQSDDRLHLGLAREDTALELEIIETVAASRRIREAQDRLGRQRFFVTQPEPGVISIRLSAIVERRLVAISDEEEVAEHLNPIALHAVAKQRGDRHINELTQKIEQRAFDRGDRVNRCPQIERLQTSSADIAIGEALAHCVQHGVVLAERSSDH